MYDDVVSKILLDSNGADDPMFSAILEGLLEQQNFKSITYKNNSFENHENSTIFLIMST